MVAVPAFLIESILSEKNQVRHAIALESGFCQGLSLPASRESELFRGCGLEIVVLAADQYHASHFAAMAPGALLLFGNGR